MAYDKQELDRGPHPWRVREGYEVVYFAKSMALR